MGKLTSLILGVIAVAGFSYYILSSYYSTLIDWLGPVFGYKMVMFFGLLFLYFGNPLQFPTLFAVWVLTGLVVAAGSRRGLRSVGSASSVFFLVFGFFLLLIFSFIFSSSSGSGLSISPLSTGLNITSLPPPPPGSSIGQILSAPVIGA
ncbi:MAG: hypothetical protein QXV22_02735, partial [Thermoplasmataceae archaeon]